MPANVTQDEVRYQIPDTDSQLGGHSVPGIHIDHLLQY